MVHLEEKTWKLKMAICDDEAIFREMILKRLEKFRPEYEIDVFESGDKLLESKQYYDIIFLDIQMPGKDGIQVGLELREKNIDSRIIYFTSYTEFAPEAFKVKAHRFLSKGCADDVLAEALNSVEADIFSDVKLCMEEDGKVIHTSIRNISCVEAYGDGVYVYMKDEIFKSKKSLSYWAEKLGTEFFYQVSRSHLVSFEHIYGFDKGHVQVEYKKESIKVSRRKRKEFEEKRILFMARRFVRI